MRCRALLRARDARSPTAGACCVLAWRRARGSPSLLYRGSSCCRARALSRSLPWPPQVVAPQWRRMKTLLPLVLAPSTLAWDAAALPAVSSGNSTDCNKCCVALTSACGAACHDMPCAFKCATCAGDHQQQLHQAGCGNDDIVAWCSGQAPPAPPPHIPPGEPPHLCASVPLPLPARPRSLTWR